MTRLPVRYLDPSEGSAGQVPTISPDGTVVEFADVVGGEATAAGISYGGSTNLSATNVEAALDELDTEKVGQGDRIRQGSRPLDSYPGVFLQSYQADNTGMVIWTQKVNGDSTDVNVDGAVIVKHGKGYVATPGYADTVQFYTLAGSAGTILGNNNYVGSGGTPYAPPTTDATTQPNGFLRFELGPVWPLSEKMRLNNRGDLIVGWAVAASGNFTQSGTTVTASASIFDANSVGKYVLWTGQVAGWCDRITGYIDATHVTVETSRSIAASTAGEVRVPKVVVRYDGTVETSDGLTVTQRTGQTGPLFKVQKQDGTTLFAVNADGTFTGLASGSSSSSYREPLMASGVVPASPLTTSDGADWLFGKAS